MSNIEKNSILIIDDEKSNLEILSSILSPDYTIYMTKNALSAVQMAEKYMPDLILLDIIMPDMDGYEVLEALKNCAETKHIPVVFITGLGNEHDEAKGLSMDAADYIGKPFSDAVVKLRVRNQIKIVNQIRTIERLSNVDQITQIPNRRSLEQRLHMEWRRAMRDQCAISFLMLDVDRFKIYNDTYGHLQGDLALKMVAGTFAEVLKRPGDFAARYGGEEFSILTPNTDIDGAMKIAEQIRKAIEGLVIPCEISKFAGVTVSIGVHSVVPQKTDDIRDLIAKADRALYDAKEAGRNRVCRYTEV